MQRSVRDIENLQTFHVLLDDACEIPAQGHFNRPSIGFQGDGQEDSQTRSSQ